MQPSSKSTKTSKQSEEFTPEAMPLVIFNQQKNCKTRICWPRFVQSLK